MTLALQLGEDRAPHRQGENERRLAIDQSTRLVVDQRVAIRGRAVNETVDLVEEVCQIFDPSSFGASGQHAAHSSAHTRSRRGYRSKVTDRIPPFKGSGLGVAGHPLRPYAC